MTDVLSTPRLVLRPFVPEDGAEMFRVWASDPQVTRFLRWTPHKDEAESLALARQWAADRQAHQWAIVRGCDGQLMGSIGVVPAEDDPALWEPGYCLGRDFWGKGYMTEALDAVVRHLFADHGVDRLGCCHAAANPASGRVMEKVGFHYTHDVMCHKFDGTPLPCRSYILYKKEYLSKL